MIYSITPGGNIPYMLPGDICLIYGREYTFMGYVNSKDELTGRKTGLYIIKSTNQLFLRHPKSETDVIRGFQTQFLNEIEKGIKEDPVVDKPRYAKEIFDPPIKPTDNYLKVRLKKVLHILQIDLRDYKDKFQNDNHYNNMRRLIIGDANLTHEKFVEWLDILNCSHEIIIYDTKGNEIIDNEGESL